MQHPALILQPATGSAIEKIEALDGPAVFPTPRIHAVAVNATEMAESNDQIKLFLAAKVSALRFERDGIRESIQVACDNGWKTDALATVDARLTKKVLYYEKLVAALDAGYTVVPNMPCDQFAIRVKRRGPSAKAVTDTSEWRKPTPRMPDEKSDVLPVGEGRYVSPIQTFDEDVSVEQLPNDRKKTTVTQWATGFDAIEFPLAAAVPIVMSATQAAMALKLFDRIGLVPQSVQRDADPIVLGQIVLWMNGRERVASFLIAWHLDMRTL